MDDQAHPQVLIVGAGPTGLLLAGQLALRGISFRIFDKNADHTTQSRALIVQARSVEIFGQMGISDEALHLGEPARGANLIIRGKRAFHFNVGNIGTRLTPFPYLLALEQSKTEAILNRFLERHGHAVERNIEVCDLTQDASGVSVRIKRADGSEETIRADWLVGADGGRSLVRHILNIPFEGRTYQQSLFVLDCQIRFPLTPNELYIIFADKAFAGLFPLSNGRWRVLGTVPDRLVGRDTITFDDIAPDFAERIELDVQLAEPHWISLYRSHHRTVARFRQGRCFLAGDAAHIHSPVGAQGMNTGLQDAYNLAWKLALVTQGKAPETLLDTYHEERITIARSLVRTTDRAFSYVTSQSRVIKVLRMRGLPILLPLVIPFAQRISRLRDKAFKVISEIGIQYRESRLSQEAPDTRFPRHAPHPGDRVPYLPSGTSSQGTRDLIAGTAFHLIIFAGSADEVTIQALRAVAARYDNAITVDILLRAATTRGLYRTFGVRDTGYYLTRPDMYIAYRSAHLEAAPLAAYLSHIFTAPDTTSGQNSSS